MKKRKQLSKRSRVTLALAGLFAAYVAPYIVLSVRGGWHGSQTGKQRYNFGLSVTDVERWFPAWAYWEPFRDVSGNDSARANPLGYFYSPLIRIDRAWMHPDHLLFPDPATDSQPSVPKL